MSFYNLSCSLTKTCREGILKLPCIFALNSYLFFCFSLIGRFRRTKTSNIYNWFARLLSVCWLIYYNSIGIARVTLKCVAVEVVPIILLLQISHCSSCFCLYVQKSQITLNTNRDNSMRIPFRFDVATKQCNEISYKGNILSILLMKRALKYTETLCKVRKYMYIQKENSFVFMC